MERAKIRLRYPQFVCLSLLFTVLWTHGCYVVEDKMIFSSLNYAKPDPGRFRYIKRDVSATLFWDQSVSKEKPGTKAFKLYVSKLAVTALKKLLYEVDLQHNQALYNVRIDAPILHDQYFFWAVLFAGIYSRSRVSVTITADVIEFI